MIRVLQTAIGVEWRNGMKLYVQFMIILVFSFLGEAISTIFHLPIPGSIIGLILLFLALEFKLIRLRHIHTV